jgi:ribosomal protein L11 methyltransferase
MEWVEVVIPVGAADLDNIAALVVDEVVAAAAGTELRGDEVVFWVPLAEGEEALAQARAATARWHEGGAAVDPARVRLAPAMPEQEWRDAWKRHFKVTRITRQVVVVPSWESYSPAAGEVVVELDPGMAFGTGTHATTRAVLEDMQALADGGRSFDRVLDVGAGSGILAIAAIKLWGATAVAIDNDPVALAACLDNAAKNGVGGRMEADRLSLADSLADNHAQYPLVLANIQAHVLRELRELLCASVAPGGTLILSGILTPQAQALSEEFVAGGMLLVRVRPSADDAQWTAVVLERPAA